MGKMYCTVCKEPRYLKVTTGEVKLENDGKIDMGEPTEIAAKAKCSICGKKLVKERFYHLVVLFFKKMFKKRENESK